MLSALPQGAVVFVAVSLAQKIFAERPPDHVWTEVPGYPLRPIIPKYELPFAADHVHVPVLRFCSTARYR
jgi:hypothetical protein